MPSIPPPQGMSEGDYETIEAAVTETVRGRWFLSEFARRNRVAETRQLLDAMARLESVVTSNQSALPSADPSIRLMIQRIKEIAAQLGAVAGDMREAGVDDRFVAAVDLQARAVMGMMRGGVPAKEIAPPRETVVAADARPAAALRGPSADRTPDLAMPKSAMPKSAMPKSAMPKSAMPKSAMSKADVVPTVDPRLAALSGLDGMTLSEKLALFS